MHKMEKKKQTESVLAKLMGLERPLHRKQLRYGRQRVLSESYLQDIALIGQHQKWSFDRFSLEADNRMLERRDSSEDLQISSSSEEFHERSRVEEKLFQKLWLISSVQKADNEYPSRLGSHVQKVKSPMKTESVAQTPLRGVLQNENIGKTKTSSSVRKRGTSLGKRERGHLLGKEALRHGSTATHGAEKQVANELQRSAWHGYLNAVGTRDAKGSQSPHVLDTELAKLNSFPGNMNTSSSKVGNGQSISNSTSITSSGSSKFRHKNFNVHKDWCLNLVNGGSSYCNSSQKVCCKPEEDLTPRNSTSIGNLQSENDVSCEETPSTPSGFSEFGQSDLFEDTPALPLSPKEISSCSDVETPLSTNKECVGFDALSQQVVEDAFMPFHQADNGSLLNQMEAYKPHPDPASHMKDISLAVNSHGSEVKLQQSTTNFFHPEAKRRKSMEVKDVEEDHHNNHREEILPGTYKTKEIQVLSYLVDILAESGLQCGNLEMFYKLRQPSENPINPFVFDSLEKKYSKQPSWLKSDRKLLFDRIECALSDILRPYMGISTRRKHRKNNLVLLQGNQDVIKQELLAMLVNQEKEAKREPSDKAVGIDRDWLEIEEDTHIVVKEIEEMLIDELMEEIVST